MKVKYYVKMLLCVALVVILVGCTSANNKGDNTEGTTNTENVGNSEGVNDSEVDKNTQNNSDVEGDTIPDGNNGADNNNTQDSNNAVNNDNIGNNTGNNSTGNNNNAENSNTGNSNTGNSNTGNNNPGNNSNAGNNTGNKDVSGTYTVGKDKLPYSDEQIFEQMFDINNVVQVNIDISKDELLQIQRDYETYRDKGSKSPIYRKASLYISIETKESKCTYYIKNVGVRMKGNTSRTDFYSKEDGQYNLIHYRVKFQDGDFATLENLELKWNKCDDSTYIREYYAYEMFRENGVLAPHVNLASTDVGGVHQGVFNIYEPVDKNFIEKNVAKEDQGGDLYKCGWTNRGADLTSACSIGVEDEEKSLFYNYDLKTNKKKSNHAQMKNLISVLNKRNVTKEEIAKVVDIDNFLMFSAVSYFVGNPDDMRNNYNNYYVYFLKSSGKAIFIPYDQDRVLGVTKEWNPASDGMTGVSPFSTKAKGANDWQKNPLFLYTVDRDKGMYVNEYTEALKKVAKSEFLTTAKFNSVFEIAKANYSRYTKPGKVFLNAQGHNFSFDLNRSNGLGSADGNASFKVYLEAKLKAYKSFVQ